MALPPLAPKYSPKREQVVDIEIYREPKIKRGVDVSTQIIKEMVNAEVQCKFENKDSHRSSAYDKKQMKEDIKQLLS